MSFKKRITFYLEYNLNDGAGWATYNAFAVTSSNSNPSTYPFNSFSLPIVSNVTVIDFRIRYTVGLLYSSGSSTTTGILLSITENPLPAALVVTPSPSTICNGTSVNIGTTPVIGNTYSWTSSIGSFSSTNSNPSVTPTLSQTYTLTETITATGCFNSNQVSITVNNVTSGTISGTQAICVEGDPFAFTSIDGTGDGTISYKWEFKPNGQNVWTVDPALLINIYDPPVGLTTTTDYRRYTISTLNTVSCTSTPTNEVRVTVNPTPDVTSIANQIKCNGISSDAINFTSSVIGATFSWTNNLSSIGIAASGTGNINSTPLTNSSNVAVVSIFNVTPTANSCPGPSRTFSITVNPTPDVTSIANQIKCNGINSDAINFTSSVSGATFTWANNLSSIGIAPSGSGNISATILTNSSTSPSIATFNVTPTANSCPGPVSTFSITVNPTPNVDAVANQIKCNGINSDAINFTSSVSGATFTWTNNLSSIGIAPSGNGSSIASTPLTNSSTSPSIATFNVTPSANSCAGPSGTFTITVNPTPNVLIDVPTQVKCNGISSEIVNFTSSVSGATFSWTNNLSSIGILASGSGNSIASTPLTNSSTSPSIATFNVTPSANSCDGPSGTFTITVNSSPIVIATSNPLDGLICEGLSVTLNGGGASTYSWTGGVLDGVAFAPTSTKSYTVIGTDINDCTNSATLTVTVIKIPDAPTTTPKEFIYDGTSHNGVASVQDLTKEEIKWYTTLTGNIASGVPTQTVVGKKEAYAEAKLIAAPFCTSSSRALVSVEVTPKALGIKNISVNNKVYDGTTSATISGTAAYDGLVAIDNNIISVVGTPTFSFDTKDVGEAKAVSVSGYEKPNNNYTISQPTTLTANITAKVLSITSASVKDKVYDGLTDAIITGTLTGIVGNEDVSYNGDGDFENKNVGTDKTITTDLSLKGADKANYLLPQITGLTANITAKVLTITSAKAENKVYDGLTDAVITGTLTGMIGTEVVDFDGKGSFADKNVGTEKEVTTAVSLTGTDKSNYSLDQINGLKANITSRSLIYSVTANSKIYDGNRNAEVEFINNKKSGDILTVIKTDAIFENKNVGIGKTVSITGIALTGTDAGNYTLTSTTATAKADITAKSLTISATATNKVYDGTVSATVSFSDDRIDNDILTVTKTAANFANKNVGSDKEVTVTGIALTGTDAGNYSLTTQTLSPRANIEARVLSVTGSIPDRFYDGTDKTIGLNLSINKIAGDDISISKTGDAFDNPNVGDNKDIIVRGLSIIPGGDAANYYLASTTAIIKGNIKPLKVNINANDAIKTETDPDPVFTFTNSPSLIAPDTFTGALSRNFLGVNNPGDYPINIGTLSAGSNYLLSLNTAKLTIKPLVTNYIFEVPNAFTPNLDGTNDLLYIIKNYRVTDLAYFRIFNRTGQMVFESRNFADGWNGKKMGDPSGNVLESDMYIWIAEFTRMNDTGGGTSIERKTGSVLLLK
jgi:gliding motility-associated-like protein